MTENDIKANWYYFRSLAKQLKDTEQFVDHSVDATGVMLNASTYSNEFAKILMLSASEFEVIAKALCAESGISLNWNANILTITKKLLTTYPNIGDTVISTPYKTIQPLKNWRVIKVKKKAGKLEDKVDGLDWWGDHNSVKHDRRKSFTTANLENCIDSMASLMVLELYLSHKVLGNVDSITSIGCSYFDCNYGLAHMAISTGNKLPDFK